MIGMKFELLHSSSAAMTQKQETSLDQVQAWQMSPWQMLETEHPVFTRMVVKNRHGKPRSLEDIYKKIRNKQILADKGPIINIDIVGPNGAGKGEIGQGFAEAFRRDDYLLYRSQEQGFRVIVVADIFAINIKVLQQPRFQRTPWAIPPGIEHGQFSPEHYQKADDFSLVLREEMHKVPKDLKIVKISERPAPTSFPVDRSVPPRLEGVNRAHGSIYADAYDTQVRDTTNFFILRRDDQVRAMARYDRISYQGDQIENPFTGHNRYWLTSKAGVIHDVSTLSPTLQSEALALLRLGTASPSAMIRGDLEMLERVDELFALGKISEPTIDSYLEFLHHRLVSGKKNQPGLPASQVHLVENDPYSGRPEYHFNNLTHNNKLMEMNQILLGSNLRRFVFGY